MEKVITISDWWDGPLCGLAIFEGLVCIYERIFNEDKDDWSDEYYLTPVNENEVNLLLKDWAIWCETVQNEDYPGEYYSGKSGNIYHDMIELSAHKRTYKRTAIFHGYFGKGFIPIDYSVEWI